MATPFFKRFPIYDVDENGIIYSDNYGAYTLAFRLKMPHIYTLSEKGYQDLIENFSGFLKLLGEHTIIHKQDRYFKEQFSLISKYDDTEQLDFIERAYNLHFNERDYLNHQTYLFLTKTPAAFYSRGKFTGYLNDKSFVDQERKMSFILQVKSAFYALEKSGFEYQMLTPEEIVSDNGIINTYLNLSYNSGGLKDISFENNSVYVGAKQAVFSTVENLGQFGTNFIDYSKKEKRGLPVSNFFSFSYPLPYPHITNQYIYIPDQKQFRINYEKQLKTYTNYSLTSRKSGNNQAANDLSEFFTKLELLNAYGVYYHFNTLSFEQNYKDIDKKIKEGFRDAEISYKENSIDRKTLFRAGIPGNSVEMKFDLLMPMTDIEATALGIWEQNYEDNLTNPSGLKLCDLIYGIPFAVDLIEQPKRKGWIKNKNITILSGTGGGKSYFANLMILDALRQGDHVFVIDASYSYKISNAFNDGIYLEFNDTNKITFNPFYIKGLSTVKQLPESKIALLISLIVTITKSDNEKIIRFEETVLRELILRYYKTRIAERSESYSFDDFYNFTETDLPLLLKENEIPVSDFNDKTFIFSLKPFLSGGSLGYLLNSKDDKIKNIVDQRFIVIDVSAIRKNKILFSVVSLLAMDIYTQKIQKLPLSVNKYLVIDEAWQSIASPQMGTFMKEQVKVTRKYGGITCFITQELDDFISSPIIKESIVNNSDIKIFLDMRDFATKFDPIQKVMGLTDKNKQAILSVNKDLRTGVKYREVCICYGNHSIVYGVETPLELKAIFETDPDEVGKILKEVESLGIELMAKNYAANNN